MAKEPSSTPALPLEIWIQCIESVPLADFHSLAHIWLACRLVSHQLKAATETVFRQRRYLDHMKLTWNVPFSTDDIVLTPSLDETLECTAAFDRLSENDRSRAVFKVSFSAEPNPLLEDYDADSIRRVWRARNTLYLRGDGRNIGPGRFDHPPHAVIFGDHIDDTPLVGMEVDCEANEVSFLWMSTLTTFFAQQLYIGILERRVIRVGWPMPLSPFGVCRDKTAILNRVRHQRALRSYEKRGMPQSPGTLLGMAWVHQCEFEDKGAWMTKVCMGFPTRGPDEYTAPHVPKYKSEHLNEAWVGTSLIGSLPTLQYWYGVRIYDYYYGPRLPDRDADMVDPIDLGGIFSNCDSKNSGDGESDDDDWCNYEYNESN
ncbi:hypothetical protein B0T24DRAFT_676213 [Lasiosphaeria ovina]|uniref:F-box domain-containing protein n=1 Tax=Lasiosphaeria ovina TaxID=92902 RepID=A0AAE0NFK9_9PEZI|nr:hypothetical protein B0T24DRAFT_676213 [Lasiosphaeria ovina]